VPKLVQHPLLTKEDKQKIDDYLNEKKKSQIKYGFIFTSGTLGFYTLFLSRMSVFQKFFNDRQKNRLVNGCKKIFGAYFVYLGWIAMLNSHYEKKIPEGLE
jgi:hypothetical protein